MPLNKVCKPILLTVALLLCALNAGAWSSADYYQGNTVFSFSARNLAMGNTGVYDTFSPMAVAVNPANVTVPESQIGVSAGGLFSRSEDARSIPLYNSFDTFIDDATYSSNIEMFTDYGISGFGRYRFGNYTAGLGVHYLPIVSFTGKYNEEVRNNRNSDNDGYPEVIAYNSIDNEGNLNALGFTLGGGIDINENLQANLGVTVNSLMGESKIQNSIRWSEWAVQQSVQNLNLLRNVLPDSVYTNVSDLKGSQIKIGTALKLNSRWGLGLSYSLKSEFDRDSDITIKYGPDTTLVGTNPNGNLQTQVTTSTVYDKYILPARLRAGFNYQPRNTMRTFFNAEIEYTQWSDVSKFYDDSWDIHIGVEHKVTNRIPLRLGFQSVTEWQATPDYANLTVDGTPAIEAFKVITPSLTAGSSVDIVKNLVLDIGLSFSWREYQALDMFRDGYYNDKDYTELTAFILWPNSHILPSDRGWENPDKVRESFTQISTGLTWTW